MLLPAFYQTLDGLRRSGRRFSIVLRTFGTDLPRVAAAINAYAAWGALNGLGMYFATDKLMEAWGASGAKIQKTFLKGFGGFLTISSLTMYMLNSGEDAIKTLGYATAANHKFLLDKRAHYAERIVQRAVGLLQDHLVRAADKDRASLAWVGDARDLDDTPLTRNRALLR